MDTTKRNQAFIRAKLGFSLEKLLEEIATAPEFTLMTDEQIADTLLERMPSKDEIAAYIRQSRSVDHTTT